MTITKGKELLLPFTDECDKDNDPYFAVHFSRQDDYYNGLWERMDKVDALIIVKCLIKEFDLNLKIVPANV